MNSFIIIVYFLILITLLSFALIKSNVHYLFKVLLIGASFWAGSAYYFHLNELKGYPVYAVHDEGRIVAIQIIKPKNDNPGGIYLWLYEKTQERTFLDELHGIQVAAIVPRSYGIEYSKANERKYASLKKQLENGHVLNARGDPAGEIDVIDPSNLKDKE